VAKRFPEVTLYTLRRDVAVVMPEQHDVLVAGLLEPSDFLEDERGFFERFLRLDVRLRAVCVPGHADARPAGS